MGRRGDDAEMTSDLERWLAASFPKARWKTPGDALGVLTHRVRLRDRGGKPPQDHLFVDLETLGFVGRPLFLVGLLYATGPKTGELVQLVARDYAEEEGTLRFFAEEYAAFPAWVTFNGKSFDVPSLRLRYAFHRLSAPLPEEHVDLLHIARRHFRGVLPDCKLRTLERRVCGRHRVDDLDGSRVPDAYHRYVRDGDPTWLEPILRHNIEDLITLVELYRVLFEMEES